MKESWRLFKDVSVPVSTAEGLAVDDSLPLSVTEHDSPPVLHLYTFVPSVIIGKYQDIEAALRLERCMARGIEYNRRSTGGGTVIMGPEIVALGLGIGINHPCLNGGTVGGIFQSLGRVLCRALERFHIKARFRPKNDLEVEGRKIAGLSAASEKGRGLLFHTSLLVDFDIPLMLDIMNTPLIKVQDKGYNCFSQRMTTVRRETGRDIQVWEVMDSIQGSFERELDIGLKDSEPDEWERENIDRLIVNRYRNRDWIFSHKHPRSRMGIGRLKTGAGLLEVYLSLSGGSIENVIITGDFFAAEEDLGRLESALRWASAREESIREKVIREWRKDMIYGLEPESLIRAIMMAKENQVRL
ncbi:MAG: hypothetical protein JRH06_03225 [Deltaproteobacteria bacterium]|nr:hypothetical protein [Deltaproteobacteria bacterium]MBW2136550.1 hypothetical protein [Deltaproteobacteria bacterium]